MARGTPLEVAAGAVERQLIEDLAAAAVPFTSLAVCSGPRHKGGLSVAGPSHACNALRLPP